MGISIIIPSYDCASTLGRTLASLVAQTDSNFEVLVIDDCSKQDIKSIVKEYEKWLNIKYIRNEKNIGCGMARQVGIDNVSSTHFMFCDSDDVIMPYTVETFNALIKDQPDTEFVHTHFYEQTVLDDKPAYILHENGFVWCHGKLYSVEAVKKYGIRNNPSVRWADDSYFNSMCSELMKITVLPQPMAIWTNNRSSVMRKRDCFRDKKVLSDFLNAMILSCEFVLSHKQTVDHLPNTLEYITPFVKPDTEEMQLFIRLSKYVRGEQK